jgi:hypothetical protein
MDPVTLGRVLDGAFCLFTSDVPTRLRIVVHGNDVIGVYRDYVVVHMQLLPPAHLCTMDVYTHAQPRTRADGVVEYDFNRARCTLETTLCTGVSRDHLQHTIAHLIAPSLVSVDGPDLRQLGPLLDTPGQACTPALLGGTDPYQAYALTAPPTDASDTEATQTANFLSHATE